MGQIFYLEKHEHIALCDLLKLTGLAESGGRAKQMIINGQVLCNGQIETRKTAKIRHHDRVSVDRSHIDVKNGYARDEG